MLPPRLAPTLFSRQVQPAYICLPSVNDLPSRGLEGKDWSGWGDLHSRPPPSKGGRLLLTYTLIELAHHERPRHVCRGSQMAARVGLAPTPLGLTGRRATLTPPGNGAVGRIPTCIGPLRRRMPHVFGHDSVEIGQRGRTCTCDPSVPSRVRWLLRYALRKGPD